MANRTIIPEDYNGLLDEYKCVRKELDNSKQELHDCKRQLKVAEALRLEYQNEIEALQAGEYDEKLQLEAKIFQLEETISNLRLANAEQISNMELELLKSQDEVLQLQKEMLDMVKQTNAAETPTEDTNKFLEEILGLKEENETLEEHNEQLKQSLGILQKKNIELEEQFLQIKEEHEHLKETLSIKKEELLEANQVVEKLNDELFCVKSELESFKTKPLDQQSKGNSLFAEVDDRRVYLQKTVNSMKSEYIQMKQENSQFVKTISHLKKENAALYYRWKQDVEQIERDQDNISRSLKDRVEILEGFVDKYRKEVEEKRQLDANDPASTMKYMQVLVSSKDQQIKELQTKLSQRALNQTMLTSSLAEARQELRKWRLEAKRFACLNDQQENIPPLPEPVKTEESEPKWTQCKKGPNLPNIQTKIYESERVNIGNYAGIMKKTTNEARKTETKNFFQNLHDPTVTDESAIFREPVEPPSDVNEPVISEIKTETSPLKKKNTDVSTSNVLLESHTNVMDEPKSDRCQFDIFEESAVISSHKDASKKVDKENVLPKSESVPVRSVKFSEDTIEPKIKIERKLEVGL